MSAGHRRASRISSGHNTNNTNNNSMNMNTDNNTDNSSTQDHTAAANNMVNRGNRANPAEADRASALTLFDPEMQPEPTIEQMVAQLKSALLVGKIGQVDPYHR
jgi:hypothetical protein